MKVPKLTASEIEALLSRDFPQGNIGKGKPYEIVSVGMHEARLKLKADESHIRPGGTVSGPTLFALADFALYIAVLASIGWVPLAVTTNLSINFLRKPVPGDLIADCKLLKVGKRLAVGEVGIRSEKHEELVAHCVGTYSIPA